MLYLHASKTLAHVSDKYIIMTIMLPSKTTRIGAAFKASPAVRWSSLFVSGWGRLLIMKLLSSTILTQVCTYVLFILLVSTVSINV